jgi:hypothetical protein
VHHDCTSTKLRSLRLRLDGSSLHAHAVGCGSGEGGSPLHDMLPHSVLYPTSGAGGPTSGRPLPAALAVDDSKYITSDAAIDALVECNFKTRAAAESLKVSHAKLLRAIADDPGAYARLRERARSIALVGAMEMMVISQDHVAKSQSEMEPAQQVGLYMGLLKQLEAFTDSKETTTNVNVHDHVVRSLPPEVRDAFLAMAKLAGEGPDASSGMVIPHEMNPNYIPRLSSGEDDDVD